MSKRSIIIIVVLSIVFVLCITAFVLTLVQSKTPTDDIYVITQNGSIKSTRGAYKWKSITSEYLADTENPYNIAIKSSKASAYQFEKVTISTSTLKGRLLNDISNIQLYMLLDETNSYEIDIEKSSREATFIAPKDMGDYYYKLVLNYKNGSIVEYEFGLTVGKRTIDAKLLNEIIQNYDGKYVGDNSSVVNLTNDINSKINPINMIYDDVKFQILDKNLVVNYYVSDKYLLNEDYLKEWNLNYAVSMFSLIQNIEGLQVKVIDENSKEVYVNNITKEDIEKIYSCKVEDIDLYEIFLDNINDANYKVLDIDKVYTPPMLYANGIQSLERTTFSWADNNNNMIHVDTIPPEDIVKDKESFNVNSKLYITLNERNSKKELYKLPENAVLKYKVLGEDEYKEAKKLKDGSFLVDLPDESGEYIYEFNLSFTGINGMHSSYVIKINYQSNY